MIAVDTNVLVYAHRAEHEFSAAARRCIAGLAQGRAAWALPWPCLHEFYAVVTNRKVFKVPTPRDRAIDQVNAWLASPTLTLLHETASHWEVLRGLLAAGQVSGPMVHDARIAALCLQHGVREFWSADRDFSRFGGLAVRNPLLG
jgi:uncharacterized protein